MIGHAAHRYAVAPGQGDLEQFGRFLGVGVEHLVEVAETEEQNRLLMATLQFPVLGHHGRSRRGGHAVFLRPMVGAGRELPAAGGATQAAL